MQYKNIALKEGINPKVFLVKYQKNKAQDIRWLEKQNAALTKMLINPDGENMAYLIIQDFTCLGAVLISPSNEVKNVNLEILLDNTKLSQDGIYKIVDNLVSSLGWYLYDKENIIIKLDNGLDLTTYNRHKYGRKPIGKGQILYQYHNRNHKLLTLLTAKMEETQNYLLNNNQYWRETSDIESIAYINNNLYQDKKTIYPLEEAFYNAKSITWNLNDTDKNKRTIIFHKDGKIEFLKTSFKDESLSYRICSWVDQNHFRLENKGLKLDMENMPTMYVINSNKIQVVNNKEDNTKQYRYSSSDKNSKVDIEIKQKSSQFQSCNIIFYTYDTDHILESEYLFEFSISEDKYAFKRLSYEGTIDLIPYLKEEDKILLFNLKKGNLPIEKLDKTIQRLVKIINHYAHEKNLNMVGYENIISTEKIMMVEDEALTYLKSISGEILIPNIQEKVQKFIEEKDLTSVKYLTRCRSLKNRDKRN